MKLGAIANKILLAAGWVGYVSLTVTVWIGAAMMIWLVLHADWHSAFITAALLAVVIFMRWLSFTRYRSVDQIRLEPDVAKAINEMAQRSGEGTQDLANRALRELLNREGFW